MESKGYVKLERSPSDVIKDCRLLTICSGSSGFIDLFNSFLLVTKGGKLLRVAADTGVVNYVFDREYNIINELKLFNDYVLVKYDVSNLDVLSASDLSLNSSFENIKSIHLEDNYMDLEFENGISKKYDVHMNVVSPDDDDIMPNDHLLKHYKSVLAALNESKRFKDELLAKMSGSYEHLLFESDLFRIFGQIASKPIKKITPSFTQISLNSSYQYGDRIIYVFEIKSKSASRISVDTYPLLDFRVLLFELNKEDAGIIMNQVNYCTSTIYCTVIVPLSSHQTEFRFSYFENGMEWCSQTLSESHEVIPPRLYLSHDNESFSKYELIALLSVLRREESFVCRSSYSDLRVLVPDVIQSLNHKFVPDWNFFIGEQLLISFYAKMDNFAIIKAFYFATDEYLKNFISKFYEKCPEDVLLETTALEPDDFGKFTSVLSEEISFIEKSLTVKTEAQKKGQETLRYESRKRKLDSIYTDTQMNDVEYSNFLSKLLNYELKTDLLIA